MAECTFCIPCEKQRPPIGLEDFRRVLKFNPYYFWQMAQDRNDPAYRETLIPLQENAMCDHLVFESGEVTGVVSGREDVWQGIRQMTRAYVDFAGVFPGPTYACIEKDFNAGWTGRGRLQLGHNNVLALGKEKLTKLGDLTIDPDVDIVDKNADGLLDTVTLIVDLPADLTSEDEVILLRPVDENDFFAFGDDDIWRREIRPVKADIVGDKLHLTFRSWLAVKAQYYSSMGPVALDPEQREIYIDSVELHRRWTDATEAVQIVRRTGSAAGCGCSHSSGVLSGESCYNCEMGAACLVNGTVGLIELNVNWSSGGCNECIDKLVVHYLSGDCDMDTQFARAVAGNMGRNLCCGKGHAELAHWQQQFVGKTAEGSFTSGLSKVERMSGLGTSLGALDLFNILRPRRRMVALRV